MRPVLRTACSSSRQRSAATGWPPWRVASVLAATVNPVGQRAGDVLGDVLDRRRAGRRSRRRESVCVDDLDAPAGDAAQHLQGGGRGIDEAVRRAAGIDEIAGDLGGAELAVGRGENRLAGRIVGHMAAQATTAAAALGDEAVGRHAGGVTSAFCSSRLAGSVFAFASEDRPHRPRLLSASPSIA